MFEFNGISNEDLKVVPVEENFFSRAGILYEPITIEGKDGTDFYEIGYTNVEKDLELQILDVSNVDSIMQWLNGSGILKFQGRETIARFYGGFDVNRFVSLKKAVVSYIRKPFWTKADDFYVPVTTIVINEGNIYSKPIIKITGTGTIDITVNGNRFTYIFDTEPYVEIDCEEMTEKYNGLSMSRHISMGLEYPKLKVGANTVTLHSGSATVEMKRKDRWL